METTLNANIERLRIVAALGIVAFHAQTGMVKSIGYAGLPTFILVTFFLGTASQLRKQEAFATLFAHKAKRLLVPFFFWVVLYLIYDCLIALVRDEKLIGVFASFSLLYGTRIHLWYLPFAFFGLLFASRIKNGITWMGTGMASSVLVLLAVVVGMYAPLFESQLPENLLPFTQYIFSTPALLFGVSLAIAARTKPQTKILVCVAIVVSTLGLGLFRYAMTGDYLNGFLISYGIAVPVTLAAIIRSGEMDCFTRAVAPLTLGIYLIHPMVIGALNRLSFFRHGTMSHLKFIFVFLLSAVAIYFAKRSRFKFAV